MGIQKTPKIKYRIIQEAIQQDNNLLKISKLCEIAGVSRSGYYNWIASEPVRKIKEESDLKGNVVLSKELQLFFVILYTSKHK